MTYMDDDIEAFSLNDDEDEESEEEEAAEEEMF